MIDGILTDVKIGSSLAGQCLMGLRLTPHLHKSHPCDTNASTDVRLVSKVLPFHHVEAFVSFCSGCSSGFSIHHCYFEGSLIQGVSLVAVVRLGEVARQS